MASQNYIKVNTSGLDFLALVLQSSNSFDLNVFFQVLFSLFLTVVYKGHTHLLFLRAVCSMGFWSRLKVFLIFFRLKFSNGFHVETHFFRRSFIFCYFCLLLWGIDFAPARGSPASVSDHVMTSQDYIKVNTSGLDFLSLVLQSSNSFDLNVFFSSFVQNISHCLQRPYSIVVFEGRVFHGVFWSRLKVFLIFFRLKPSNCFPVKTNVFERFLIFCVFVRHHGALFWTCTWWLCQRH